jgi:hypothetical protein
MRSSSRSETVDSGTPCAQSPRLGARCTENTNTGLNRLVVSIVDILDVDAALRLGGGPSPSLDRGRNEGRQDIQDDSDEPSAFSHRFSFSIGLAFNAKTLPEVRSSSTVRQPDAES